MTTLWACWLPPGLPGVGALRVGLAVWPGPQLCRGFVLGRGVPLRECSIDQEPRPAKGHTGGQRGQLCCVPLLLPKLRHLEPLQVRERHRLPAGGGSDWPGRGPCERGREAFGIAW